MVPNGKIVDDWHIRMAGPVAARSEAWVCGLSLAGIVGRIPPGALMFVSCECLCRQVEGSVSSLSLVQRSLTECDREAP